MHMTHLVIDDFFNDPHKIREQAFALNYPPRPEKALYPGRNAETPLSLPGIENLVSHIVHEPLVAATDTSHCYPRLTYGGQKGEVSVHVDWCHWSAIVYMSLDEHCQGGTHFYRHIPSGLDMAPVFPGMAEAAGYPDTETAVKEILDKSENVREDWEEIMMIPMKFNRLVIFRGYIWHDAGVAFGDTPENARLIVPFFFRNTNPQPA